MYLFLSIKCCCIVVWQAKCISVRENVLFFAELKNLTLRGVGTNVTKDGGVVVGTGGTVSFFTNLGEGYQPNVVYK